LIEAVTSAHEFEAGIRVTVKTISKSEPKNRVYLIWLLSKNIRY
jgi:hypothetical protein